MAKSYKYKRSRKPLTLDDCKLRLTDAVKAVEKIVLQEGKTNNEIVQAVHALSGAINRYAKLVETTDLLERIQRLEEQYNAED